MRVAWRRTTTNHVGVELAVWDLIADSKFDTALQDHPRSFVVTAIVVLTILASFCAVWCQVHSFTEQPPAARHEVLRLDDLHPRFEAGPWEAWGLGLKPI